MNGDDAPCFPANTYNSSHGGCGRSSTWSQSNAAVDERPRWAPYRIWLPIPRAFFPENELGMNTDLTQRVGHRPQGSRIRNRPLARVFGVDTSHLPQVMPTGRSWSAVPQPSRGHSRPGGRTGETTTAR